VAGSSGTPGYSLRPRLAGQAVVKRWGRSHQLGFRQWRDDALMLMTGIKCERDGKGWLVRAGDVECTIEDSVGMAYLAVLLDNPGYEISALELASGQDATSVDDGRRSEQPFLDEAAVRSYRARLTALRAEMDEYQKMHDMVRAERARVEYDWLISELVSATGLGGRARRFADNEERARVSVGKAIRRAIGRIAAVEPGIGEQLRTTIYTGMRCRYQPRRNTQPLAARASVGARRAARIAG